MVFLYTKYTINILRIDQLFQQNPPIKITDSKFSIQVRECLKAKFRETSKF